MTNPQQTYSQWRKTESIYYKIRNKARMPTSQLLFNIIFEVLTTAIKEEKERNNPDWKRSKTHHLQMA